MTRHFITFIIFLGLTNFVAAQIEGSVCAINNVCYALDQSGSISRFYNDIRAFTITSAVEIDRRTVDTTYSAYGFSDDATTIQEPTKDLNGSFVPSVQSQRPAFGNTDISAGLQECLDTLKVASGNRTAILITDGQGGDPLPLKPQFVSNGIGLVTVGIGNGVNHDLLRELATREDFYLQFGKTTDLLSSAIEVTDKLCEVVDPNPVPSSVPVDSCESAYQVCDFQFFGRDTVPEYSIGKRPDFPFTDPIVSKTDPAVGILNTNGIDVEFIDDDSSKPITSFGDPSLTPTHFKPLSFTNRLLATGIGHQTFTGNQIAVSQRKCVRVSFTNFQVISTSPSPHVIDNVNDAQKSDNKCVVFKTI